MLKDVSTNEPCEPGLYGVRPLLLLRHQYVGRRCTNLNIRAQRRHNALYVKTREYGWRVTLQSDLGFLEGLNVHAGKVTYQAVEDAAGMDYTPFS